MVQPAGQSNLSVSFQVPKKRRKVATKQLLGGVVFSPVMPCVTLTRRDEILK